MASVSMSKPALKNTNLAVKAGFTGILVLVHIFGVFSLYQLKNSMLTMTDTIAINSNKIVHLVLMRDSILRQ